MTTESNFKCEVITHDLNEFDFIFKLIVIGDCGVGKSCLAIKAIKNYFEELYSTTIGFEFLSFNIKVEDQYIKLQIWDTCGQESYRSLINSFYRNASLAILVYSIDCKESFESLENWLNDVKKLANPDIKIILIGNKVDLEDKREVPKEKGEQFCKDHKLNLFLETSAKNGFNAKNLFMKAGTILYEEHLKIKANVSRPGSVLPVTYIPEITESTTEEDNRPKKKCVC